MQPARINGHRQPAWWRHHPRAARGNSHGIVSTYIAKSHVVKVTLRNGQAGPQEDTGLARAGPERARLGLAPRATIRCPGAGRYYAGLIYLASTAAHVGLEV